LQLQDPAGLYSIPNTVADRLAAEQLKKDISLIEIPTAKSSSILQVLILLYQGLIDIPSFTKADIEDSNIELTNQKICNNRETNNTVYNTKKLNTDIYNTGFYK
jgi:hypothetical protein